MGLRGMLPDLSTPSCRRSRPPLTRPSCCVQPPSTRMRRRSPRLGQASETASTSPTPRLPLETTMRRPSKVLLLLLLPFCGGGGGGSVATGASRDRPLHQRRHLHLSPIPLCWLPIRRGCRPSQMRMVSMRWQVAGAGGERLCNAARCPRISWANASTACRRAMSRLTAPRRLAASTA